MKTLTLEKMTNKETIYGNVKVVCSIYGYWGVTDLNDETIVPFGKYDWIDGYDNGLARVNKIDGSGKKWGIIDENGDEVLPVKYDSIWNFLGKNRRSTKVEKDGSRWDVYFSDLNPSLDDDDDNDDYYDRDYDRSDYGYDSSDDWMSDTWDAMTDGMYGDMPEGFNGDFDWLGY